MKNTLRVNELAKLIGVEFKPGKPLTIDGTSTANCAMWRVADQLTRHINIAGVTVKYDSYNTGFMWCVDSHTPYGPGPDLALRYGQKDVFGYEIAFDYDENGFLLDPFQILDGAGVDEAYGFDADNNKSYCVPVFNSSIQPTENGRKTYYVRPTDPHHATSLLYISCWGGANEDTRGINQDKLAELGERIAPKTPFVSRSMSKGGKQGIDYYVLPLDYGSVFDIVYERYERSQAEIERKRKEYAKKFQYVETISEQLLKIEEASGVTEALVDLVKLDGSKVAQATYVDRLVADLSLMKKALVMPSLDCSLESLEERYNGMSATELICHRSVEHLTRQMARWKAASKYFDSFYERVMDLGGAMIVDLYKIRIVLPSMAEAGQTIKKSYLINKVQLTLLDKKLKKYEDFVGDVTKS